MYLKTAVSMILKGEAEDVWNCNLNINYKQSEKKHKLQEFAALKSDKQVDLTRKLPLWNRWMFQWRQ